MEIINLQNEKKELQALLNREKLLHAQTKFMNSIYTNALTVSLSNAECQKRVIKSVLTMNENQQQ